LSRQRGDNLFAILGPPLPEDVLTDAGADLPVERGQPGIHRPRSRRGAPDHLPDLPRARRFPAPQQASTSQLLRVSRRAHATAPPVTAHIDAEGSGLG
jgi:hypothetical protein